MHRPSSHLPSSVSLLVAVAMTLALAVGLPGPHAAADPSSADTGADAGTGTDASLPLVEDTAETLEQATRALSGSGGDEERVEATLALRDLFLARPALSGDEELVADGLLARPSDGARDPYGDGYTAPKTKKCGANVCVHWVRSGADAPPDDAWAAKTLSVMEKVWRHHTGKLGYRKPAKDGKRGGNNKFDVYLKDVGSRGLFGYCAPERRVKGKPKQASGFCVLDNDFARAQFDRAPVKTLRVTAAHEFFHAIQFAYDFTEDKWLFESTATWIEERFADNVNDNRSYLRFGQAAVSTKSLDIFETSGLAHYGNWVFWEFLTERYGNKIVRQVLERTGTGGGLPDDYSTQALRKVLRSKGGLPRQYAAFAAANTQPQRSYDEGASFPGVDPIRVATLRAGSPRAKVTTRINHLAAKTVRVKPGGLKAKKWRLDVKVNGPRAAASPAVSVLVLKKNGKLLRRQVALSRSGKGRATLGFSSRSVRSVGITLANVSTRYRCDSNTFFACSGRPLDQRAKFTMTAKAVRG